MTSLRSMFACSWFTVGKTQLRQVCIYSNRMFRMNVQILGRWYDGSKREKEEERRESKESGKEKEARMNEGRVDGKSKRAEREDGKREERMQGQKGEAGMRQG